MTSDHGPVPEPACAFTDFQGQVLPLDLASVWRQTCCFADSSCKVGFIPPLYVYCSIALLGSGLSEGLPLAFSLALASCIVNKMRVQGLQVSEVTQVFGVTLFLVQHIPYVHFSDAIIKDFYLFTIFAE